MYLFTLCNTSVLIEQMKDLDNSLDEELILLWSCPLVCWWNSNRQEINHRMPIMHRYENIMIYL